MLEVDDYVDITERCVNKSENEEYIIDNVSKISNGYCIVYLRKDINKNVIMTHKSGYSHVFKKLKKYLYFKKIEYKNILYIKQYKILKNG
jgi:hypothetical protein